MQSPTVLRRRIGSELRKMRERQGLTSAHVAKTLGCSESKVSRIESGKSPLSDKDAKKLLTLYGVDDPEEIRQFADLVRKSRQQGWWHSYGDALPSWFRPYVGFETDAAQIKTFQTELVPGLLQTQSYASVIIRSSVSGLSADEIEARAAARTQRQHILRGDHPTKLWVVLNEAVLRRVVGSASVMREQLLHIAEMSEDLATVTVQVLPFDAGVHPALGYSFSILSFEDIPGSIVYSEGLTGATYMEKDIDLRTHDDIFAQLMATATGPERSIALIREIADGYTDD